MELDLQYDNEDYLHVTSIQKKVTFAFFDISL